MKTGQHKLAGFQNTCNIFLNLSDIIIRHPDQVSNVRKFVKPRKVIVIAGKDVCVSCRLFLFHIKEGA